ncbi:cytochrome P450 [Lactarius indigo]|nr:cytochrome P450 [Lactarius indigo]
MTANGKRRVLFVTMAYDLTVLMYSKPIRPSFHGYFRHISGQGRLISLLVAVLRPTRWDPQFPGSSFPYYHLSPDCVWELATTCGGFASSIGSRTYSGCSLLDQPMAPSSPWSPGSSSHRKFSRQRQSFLIAEEPFILVALASLWLKKSFQAVFYSSFSTTSMTAGAVADGQLIRALQKWQFAIITTSYVKKDVLLTSALLANPGALEKHFQRAATSATITDDDKNLKGILAFANRMTSTVAPGAYLVELFPWMLHIPESGITLPQSEGSERPSLSASIFKGSDQNQLSHQEMSWLAGTLFIAGSDTTSLTMNWWALAMIAHPEVQKRAHIELDTVVGRSRTPTFSDAPNLPYIQAIIKEALRWRPALPFSVPHSTTEDDWYNGMFIPKGTICLTNLLQCNRDSYYGDDAANFRPERFLGAHGEILPGPAETHEDGHGSYGFGKRACVGKHMANDSLFIYIATTLWAVTLERVRDEDGNEVPLDVDAFVDIGMNLKPAPYECKITPRFDEVVSILAAEEEAPEDVNTGTTNV